MSGALTAPDTWRVFTAISIPEHVKDGIELMQNQLRRAVPATGGRWIAREQWHLTLKFLGNVDVARLDMLTASIRAACAGRGVLHLRAGQIGFFPGTRRPRVIWIRVRDAQDQLSAVHRAVETAAAGFISEAPDSGFTGHVTIGRYRVITGSQAQTLSALAKKLDDHLLGEWTADRVDIIRSELFSGGARYTTLASLPL